MESGCLVFFRSGACDLDAAARSLAGYGLTVTRTGDAITAGRPGSPEFRIRLATGEWVRANYRFHDVIYEAAAVPYVEGVAKSARRTFLSRWRPGGPEIDDLYEQNARQHHAILDAIAARSAAGARALAHEHVLHSCRLLEVILDHVAPHAA